MTEAGVKMAAHRLRARYRERLRDEIARTVGDTAEIDEEIHELLAALSP
jgi:RNA polymerase sigma-70 factor (ECF subfamily)